MANRFFNKTEDVVSEAIEGLVASHPHLLLLDGFPQVKVVFDGTADKSKVALISGGGSGHEPAHAGYVGKGMLTAAVAGDVFASPPTEAVLAAIRAVTHAPGVLLIVKNYTGDRLNFGLAVEQARTEGYKVEMIVVGDDCALPHSRITGRRGIAGTVFVHKVAGAAAAAGHDLSAVLAAAESAAQSVGSMGVATSVCTLPGAQPTDPPRIGPGEMELGLGIHGEPGASKGPLLPVDAIVLQVLERIISTETGYLSVQPGDRVALLVNSLGSTTPLELSIVARAALTQLKGTFKLAVARVFVGSFMTSLNMAGFSLSLLLLDDARTAALDAPTQAPAWPAPQGELALHKAPVPLPRSCEDGEGSGRPQALTPFGKVMERALLAVCDALIAAAPKLDDLDSRIGDGDCGSTLRSGAEAVKAAVGTSLPLNHAGATLRGLAKTLRVMGGTSGALYNIGLTAAAGELLKQDASGAAAAAAGEGGPSATKWGNALEAAVTALLRYSGAAEGDRTMLDALIPAQQHFTRALQQGHNAAAALDTAAAAAQEGAERTRGMAASAGRSSYVPEAVLKDVPDPGACAVAAWMGALAAVVPR
ncbi:g9491 [Coccomyxa elongata]